MNFKIFWFAVSVLIFISTGILAVLKSMDRDRNYKQIAIIITVGIFFSNAVLLSSIIYFGNTETVTIDSQSKKIIEEHSTEYKIIDEENEIGYSILFGVIYATKMNGLGLKYPTIVPAAFEIGSGKQEPLGFCYGVYLIIMIIITPIAFGGLIASFFEGLLTLLYFYLSRPFRDVYYFSELNQKSLQLAKDIKRKKRKSLIVFCNKEKKVSDDLLHAVKYMHFVLLSRRELDFAKCTRNKSYFFEITEDKIKNLKRTKKLLDIFDCKKLSKRKRERLIANTTVYFFTSDDESIVALKPDNNRIRSVNLISVNKYKTLFYDLLLRNPIFNVLKDGRKDFSITVIGAGYCGLEFVKACAWCTQMGDDYSTKINVIDKNADYLKTSIQKECPELFNKEYSINYYKENVDSATFDDLLLEKCGDTNFITIAVGDDEKNLRLAMDLRKLFIAKDSAYSNKPRISVLIDNADYRKNMQKIFSEYELEPFGCDSDYYSHELLLNSDVEKIAMNSFWVYNHTNEPLTIKEKRKQYFKALEVDRRSNRTNAIHSVYKLYILGYLLKKECEATEEEKSQNLENLAELKKIICDKTNPQTIQLAKIEHARWTAFYRSEGWCGVPLEKLGDFKKAHETSRSKQKDEIMKLHSCICPWEDLPKVNEFFGKDFIDYDFEYIKKIPLLLGFEKEENPEKPEINISNVKYVLIKR